jgi:stage IV sporulation protein A
MSKMRDFAEMYDAFNENEDFDSIKIAELNLGNGTTEYQVNAKNDLFYKVLSENCDENISDDYELMSYIRGFSESKRKFDKIKQALLDAEENGYGVVLPTVDEMNLDEPMLVKHGGRFGVKLKATAPSLHIMKVDVATEVAPIVGSEKQSEDLINYVMNKFEDNPSGIWDTNMFGKSLYDLVSEGLSGKITAIPKDAQDKMRKTLTRIVNENRGGVICILL